jgi:hypothetical protein
VAVAALVLYAVGAAHVVGRSPALSAHLESAPRRLVPHGYLSRPATAEAAAAHATRQLAATAGVLLAVASLLAATRWERRAVWGLPIVLGSELLWFAFAHRGAGPASLPYPPEWRKVGAAAGEARVRHASTAFANQGMLWNHLDAWGYDANPNSRYAAFMDDVDQLAGSEGLTSPRLHAVTAMLRWKYLLGLDAARRPAAVPLPEPLPRALLLSEYTVNPDRAGMMTVLLRGDFDPRSRVLLEVPPQPPPAPGNDPPGTVQVIASSTDTLDLDVQLSRAAVLLVTDAYARGWRVVPLSAAGQDVYEVLPANQVLRAVPLSPGRHRLRMEFLPLGFRVGRVLSVAALLTWIGAVLWFRRRLMA